MLRQVRLALLAAVMTCGPAVVAADELTIVGSGDGVIVLEAVAADEYHLGRVGWPPKPDEQQAGLSYIPYAIVPLAFVVHKSAGINALSSCA